MNLTDDIDELNLRQYEDNNWLSGNALVSISIVTLRRARLVLGWVTICRWVNHLGMQSYKTSHSTETWHWARVTGTANLKSKVIVTGNEKQNVILHIIVKKMDRFTSNQKLSSAAVYCQIHFTSDNVKFLWYLSITRLSYARNKNVLESPFLTGRLLQTWINGKVSLRSKAESN